MTTSDINNEYPERVGCGRAFVGMLAALGLLLLMFSLASCKQVQTIVEVREKIVRDTTVIHDSVNVWRDRVVYRQGDTVYDIRTVTKYKYKYLDRIQIEQVHDSVPYPVEVEKPVVVRTGYDRFVSWGFWIFVALFVLSVVWWCVKKFYFKK